TLRSTIAALALFLALRAARRRPTLPDLAVSLTYAGTMVLFVLANKLTTAASTIFLQDAAPLYVLLLSPWLLKEPIRRREIGAMVAMAAGLVLVFVGLDPVSATAPRPLTGNVLAVLSGLLWAGTVMGFRHLGKRGEEGGGAVAAVWGNLVACALCLPEALPLPAGR